MRRKIENPKVFISYAWGSDAYQQKVLVFVNKLMDDGIQVVFDKFDLKEGNDTYAFMRAPQKVVPEIFWGDIYDKVQF